MSDHSTCDACGHDMTAADGCRLTHYDSTPRKPRDPDAEHSHAEHCPGCRALPGQHHHPGCYLELCPDCDHPAIECEHDRWRTWRYGPALPAVL